MQRGPRDMRGSRYGGGGFDAERDQFAAACLGDVQNLLSRLADFDDRVGFGPEFGVGRKERAHPTGAGLGCFGGAHQITRFLGFDYMHNVEMGLIFLRKRERIGSGNLRRRGKISSEQDPFHAAGAYRRRMNARTNGEHGAGSAAKNLFGDRSEQNFLETPPGPCVPTTIRSI